MTFAFMQLIAQAGGQLVLLVSYGIGQLLMQRLANLEAFANRLAELNQTADKFVILESFLQLEVVEKGPQP